MSETIKGVQVAGVLAGGAAAALLVYLLAPILTPFLAGALLAYLGNPLVDRLAARRLPRVVVVTLVFLFIFGVLLLIPAVAFPLLERQVSVFIERWPDYLDTLQTRLGPWLHDTLGISVWRLDVAQIRQALLDQWQQAGGVAARVVVAVTQSGLAIVQWLLNLLLIPVVTFYLLRDWHDLVHRLRGLLPRPIEPTVTRLARECDEVLATFLRGQLLVMLALGLLYSIGLWLVGLDLAFLIGMGAGLVSFIPYLGPVFGLLAGGVAAAAQFHDLFHPLLVLGVFVAGQMLEGMALTPWLVGDRVGLHPVAVIFAVMAGGQLFGVVGILLALPVAAVIAVLLRHLHRRYLHSEVYGMDDGTPGQE
ncbi:MAG: AI-2E family transporter [Gammaproteobacteria bacterium]|nr:AI-2E family transporter [Gammaproteobacteria bacterium]